MIRAWTPTAHAAYEEAKFGGFFDSDPGTLRDEFDGGDGELLVYHLISVAKCVNVGQDQKTSIIMRFEFQIVW
jgi:hypothetical protein